MATRLVSRLRRELDVEVPLSEIFRCPMLGDLVAVVAGQESKGVLPAINRVSRAEPLVLSYAQQRLWFIDQLEGSSAHYNMPGALRLTGVLNKAALGGALEKILSRHEVLRSRFVGQGESVCQVVMQDYELPLRQVDLREVAEVEAELEAYIAEEAGRPFDLSADVLLRSTLLQVADEEHVLLFNLHHIASDGWSMGILVEEFAHWYAWFHQGNTEGLPELPVQYADYASWQRGWLQGEVLASRLEYWRAQLADMPLLHGLPLDYVRPARQTFKGQQQTMTLSPSLSQSLKSLAESEGVTLFMLLQTAFAVLLGRYSNNDDIVMGSPVAGRQHEEVESLIGFFVNTLVLRTRLDGQACFRELLQSNRKTLLEAFAHQDVPFEMLVEQLRPQRSLSHHPLVQIMFSVQNLDEQ
ncbi:condensation domain-containing protein, partial [Pseudoalteromonas sp. MMG006]|uniref:condensation domain-containing protein n=1 Tax=Pseudoalteromonas sp. MMG006 TaxID=2822683 RepID=UPI0024943AE8